MAKLGDERAQGLVAGSGKNSPVRAGAFGNGNRPDIGHTAIENEVRRRLADALAAAGVGQGRVSLEILYMLPPEFVRAYTRLFDQALKEELASGGGGDRDENVRKAIKGKPRLKARGKERGWSQGARAGGRRYKNHWVVRDEHAFKVKASIDRKLQRMVREIERELKNRDRDEGLQTKSGPERS